MLACLCMLVMILAGCGLKVHFARRCGHFDSTGDVIEFTRSSFIVNVHHTLY